MTDEIEKLPTPPVFNRSVYRPYDLRDLGQFATKRIQKLLRLGNRVHASFNQLAWLADQPVELLDVHAEAIMDWYRDRDLRALLDCNWHRADKKKMAEELTGNPDKP